jgi:hypothetical protein
MSNALLKPGTYVPDEHDVFVQKRRKALLQMLVFYGMTLAGLGSIAFAVYGAEDLGGAWVAFGFTIVCLLISIWGTYSFYTRATFGYQIVSGRIRMLFETVDYYVPPHIMEPYLLGIMTMFDRFFLEKYGKPTQDVVEVRLLLLGRRPIDPIKRGDPDKLVGTSYFGQSTSNVYGPYALNEGGLGYEFRLQLCHYIIPDTTEPEKLQWMLDNDLYND